MLDVALKVLNKITENGYQAYIVGGFVRDHILGIESKDIDVTTNATPKELKEIFVEAVLPTEDYGSIILVYKGIRFEITTFRREISYKDHRKPVEIEYIDNLYEDLKRRDFTINTICINNAGEVIDFLNGKEDLNKKLICTVGNSDEKLSEDALRILRAVRFSVLLNFDLASDVESAIINNRALLHDISYQRKKEELDKIFVSSNAKEGIEKLLDLGLDKSLDLDKLKDVTYTDSLIGIWAILDVVDIYPFTKNEKDLIKNIREMLNRNVLDPYNLYKYGLYVCSVVAGIQGKDLKKVTEAHNSLAISSRKELVITTEKIMELLNREEGPYLKDIYEILEKEVLYRRVKNEEEELEKYIVENYK